MNRDLRRRIEKGHKWLIARFPDYVTRINLDRLSMGSTVTCITGLAGNSMYTYDKVGTIEQKMNLGFSISGADYGYETLTKAWKEFILEKRKPVEPVEKPILSKEDMAYLCGLTGVKEICLNHTQLVKFLTWRKSQ